MRNSNLVKLYEGFYVSFSGATAFSITPGTQGWVTFENGSRIDLTFTKPFEIYDGYIKDGYCINNELTIYNNKIPIEEISGIVAESGERLTTENAINFLVTEYKS